MAPPAGTLRVGRYFFALLAIIVVLYAIVFWPGARHTPKLGLDLEGGTQVIFTARTSDGKAPSSSSMKEAQQIMEARVNGTGVTEATVVVQGNNQLVVSIPGSTTTDISQLGAAAQLTMRGLVMPIVPLTPIAPSGSSSATVSKSTSSSPANTNPTSSAAAAASSGASSPAALAGLPANAPTTPPAPSGSATASGSPTPAPSGPPTAPSQPARVSNPLANLGFPVPTTDVAFEALPAQEQQALRQAVATVDCTTTNQQSETAPYYIACNANSNATATGAYLLGPVIVPGTEIKSANAVAPNPSAGKTAWTVGLTFKSTGDANWAKYTGAHNVSGLGGSVQPDPSTCSTGTVPCAVFVAFTLDGQVISAPYNQSAINGGTTEISGQFTQSTANDLANQLKYGALPLSFTNQAAQTVSPTLGSAQLKAGLLAGGIGLALVIIYSLIYYRALGLVTIASLIVSGILTYGALVVLGTQIGFTLSLAGIAGFIVAVGITADSFVVFFERLKDEVRDGRSIRVAVPRAWVRARRTILSADTVSFLAAAILYYFAAGDVKGFAFTLGLSTILDLVVVFLFTHPLVSLLSRSRAFGSARFTGLDALRGTPIIETPAPARADRSRAVSSETAAERAAARHGTTMLAERQDDGDADAVVDGAGEADEYEDGYDDGYDDDAAAEGVADVDDEDAADLDGEDAADAETDDIEVDEPEESEPEPVPVPAAKSVRGASPRTAAERAAARRARMRAPQADNGRDDS